MEYAQMAFDGTRGGNLVVWCEYRDTIKALLEKFKLKALGQEFLPQQGYALTQSMVRPWPNGGMRGPHLHYGRDVYPLSAEQWTVFTSEVIQDVQQRLESAQTVPLTLSTVAQIGEVGAGLPVLNPGKD